MSELKRHGGTFLKRFLKLKCDKMTEEDENEQSDEGKDKEEKDLREEIRERMEERRKEIEKREGLDPSRGRGAQNPMAQMMQGMMDRGGRRSPARGTQGQEKLAEEIRKLRVELEGIKSELKGIREELKD